MLFAVPAVSLVVLLQHFRVLKAVEAVVQWYLLLRTRLFPVSKSCKVIYFWFVVSNFAVKNDFEFEVTFFQKLSDGLAPIIGKLAACAAKLLTKFTFRGLISAFLLGLRRLSAIQFVCKLACLGVVHQFNEKQVILNFFIFFQIAKTFALSFVKAA